RRYGQPPTRGAGDPRAWGSSCRTGVLGPPERALCTTLAEHLFDPATPGPACHAPAAHAATSDDHASPGRRTTTRVRGAARWHAASNAAPAWSIHPRGRCRPPGAWSVPQWTGIATRTPTSAHTRAACAG